MAFELLAQRPKTIVKGTSMVRVSITETRKGSGKLRTTIVFADTFITSLPDYKNIKFAVMYEGTGEDLGKLLVVFSNNSVEGSVKLAKFPAGGARVQTQTDFAVKPQFPIGMLDCKIVSRADYDVVIELPVTTWKDAETAKAAKQASREEEVKLMPLLAEAPKPAPQVSSPRVPTPATKGKAKVADTSKDALPVNIDGQLITSESYCRPREYLSRKGVTLSKLANNFWQYALDGQPAERITTEELLLRINSYRKRNGLPPITRQGLAQED